MKKYVLILEDKSGNELTRIKIKAKNQVDADQQAKICKATNKINDSYKVIVKSIL